MRRRGLGLLLVAVAGLAAVTGCSNTPPPPLVTSPVAQTSPSRSPEVNELVVGVDVIGDGGLNPHALADQNRTAAVLAQLMLPSVFRTGPDGTPRLDRTLMTSAEVTRSEPFTVTYSLRHEASWSDGAPIAAEDFVYLYERMRSEPGVVDPAGYRLISKVNSRGGGKTVEVVFTKPYPGWRSLFSNLLPAHLLKDAPGGWARALHDSYPTSGGPFSMNSLDRGRGEIVLERNDRYWDRPAALERIVLRAADHGGLARAVDSGDDQAVLLRADAVAMNTLRALTGVSLSTVPRATVVQVLLRPSSPRLADPKVRAAVAAALDRPALIAAGTGGGPGADLVADAQVLPPSRPGYTATAPGSGAPTRPDPEAVQRLLTEAGYTKTAGTWIRDNQPLSLVIAAPEKQEPYATLAALAQKQLTAAGIEARVITPDPDRLYGQLLAGDPTSGADQVVDLAVLPRAVGGDGATALASAFGCRVELPGGSQQSPPNQAGFCDPALQPTIEAALTGATTLVDVVARVEPALWQQAVAIPLFQLTDVLVTRPEAVNVTAGPPLATPFANAAEWRRKPR
ncbi:ABC transporter family substrate-binding protein [Streptoalloteichus tenebrarius]|uniref:ABC transporter family substrate-binding protein n=1 Tax=Streptoalloteichus tenebrarius (strain ATCC 17920 / DSM 40477 / JCM 4838 / CBS 697.72 / NBRC 16177 / NCIMB 11028 / NRRL B-12390 / A12253. 1 / ISP 5477) TaxID=1933 RepID=UPI0020A45B1A|nr:ABC transporter family substrate-binding protein [Streptoalloteichus tenebrarius]BFF01094.1 ABC transporter family substrate-binding protein [Streptoalloteichus tenebrarius]